jgi:hypothetical protein
MGTMASLASRKIASLWLSPGAHEAQLITSALCCGSRANFGPDLASTSAEPAPGDPP